MSSSMPMAAPLDDEGKLEDALDLVKKKLEIAELKRHYLGKEKSGLERQRKLEALVKTKDLEVSDLKRHYLEKEKNGLDKQDRIRDLNKQIADLMQRSKDDLQRSKDDKVERIKAAIELQIRLKEACKERDAWKVHASSLYTHSRRQASAETLAPPPSYGGVPPGSMAGGYFGIAGGGGPGYMAAGGPLPAS